MTFQERLGALIATIRKLSESSYEQFASTFSEKDFWQGSAKCVVAAWRADDPHKIVEGAFYECETHSAILDIIEERINGSHQILGREGLFDDTKPTEYEIASFEYDVTSTPDSILKKYSKV